MGARTPEDTAREFASGDRHCSFRFRAKPSRPGVMNMRDAMRFTLPHPVSAVIIGCDNIAPWAPFSGK